MSSAIRLSDRELRRFLQQEADMITGYLSREETPNPEFLRVHTLAMLPWIELLEASNRPTSGMSDVSAHQALQYA